MEPAYLPVNNTEPVNSKEALSFISHVKKMAAKSSLEVYVDRDGNTPRKLPDAEHSLQNIESALRQATGQLDKTLGAYTYSVDPQGHESHKLSLNLNPDGTGPAYTIQFSTSLQDKRDLEARAARGYAPQPKAESFLPPKSVRYLEENQAMRILDNLSLIDAPEGVQVSIRRSHKSSSTMNTQVRPGTYQSQEALAGIAEDFKNSLSGVRYSGGKFTKHRTIFGNVKHTLKFTSYSPYASYIPAEHYKITFTNHSLRGTPTPTQAEAENNPSFRDQRDDAVGKTG